MPGEITKTLQRIYEAGTPSNKDLIFLLSLVDSNHVDEVYSFADKVRLDFMGKGILLRGLIEFSNVCKQNCLYCGLNYNNKRLKRYRLSKKEILDSVNLVVENNIKTAVLQSGEDDTPALWLAEIIKEIKENFDIAITLSVGERLRKDYKIWKDAGADRYLLKIETTNRALYKQLNPGMSFENRLRCLVDLKELGYQVGCGNLVGLPNQTIEMLVEDIVFFKNNSFDMIGIGPFIPHPDTRLAGAKSGMVDVTLRVLALTRIVTKNTHLPATTALGSLDKDYRIEGLSAGANVLMPNFTPLPYKKLYEIYPNKRCVSETQGACGGCMEAIAVSAGRTVDYSRGDTFKKQITKK